MRLRTQLMIFVGLAYVLPLMGLGLWVGQRSSRAVDKRVVELQASTADNLASFVDTWVGLKFGQISEQARSWKLAQLDTAEREAFVRLVFRQVPEANIVALVDGEGQPIHAAYLTRRSEDLGGRDPIDSAHFDAWRGQLPMVRAVESGEEAGLAFIGPPQLPEGRYAPVLPVVFTLGQTDLFLAVELALDPIAERLAVGAGDVAEHALLDEASRVFAVGGPVAGPEGAAAPRLVVGGVFRPFQRADVSTEEVAYTTSDGVEVLASATPVPRTGWMVVVAERREATSAASVEIRNMIFYAAAVVCLMSLVVGVLYAQHLTGPVVHLTEAASAVAEGDLGRTVRPEGTGEIHDLTETFNVMSARLKEQKASLDAAAAELQRQLEEQKSELDELHSKLIQSARLSAVGEMGAGLAHELNNPMMGILNLSQIVLARNEGKPDEAMLRSIEAEARRCTLIIKNLQRYADKDSTDTPVDRADWDVVDLHSVVADVLGILGAKLRSSGVSVEHHVSGELRVRGDRAELGRGISQLLASMSTAARKGGTVTIGGKREKGVVELALTLLAPVVRMGTDDWKASGMGVWGARSVFADHQGRLVEPPARPVFSSLSDAESATWRVILPEA